MRNIGDKTIEGEIKRFVALLKKRNIRISKVILFGSFARGSSREHSDIDLAVVSPDFGKDEISEMMELSKIAWRISDRIEAIPLSEEMLKMKYHPLIGEIKKYGKIVYES